MGVDVSPVIDELNRLKVWWTGKEKEPELALKEHDPLAEFWTVLLMAAAAHKLILPVRLGLTAAATPYVSRWVKGQLKWMRKM